MKIPQSLFQIHTLPTKLSRKMISVIMIPSLSCHKNVSNSPQKITIPIHNTHTLKCHPYILINGSGYSIFYILHFTVVAIIAALNVFFSSAMPKNLHHEKCV